MNALRLFNRAPLRKRTIVTGASTSSKTKVVATQTWLETIVVGQKLCPFAPPLIQRPELVRIVSCAARDKTTALQFVREEVEYLMMTNNCGVHQDDDDDNNNALTSSHGHDELLHSPPPIHQTSLIVFDDPLSNEIDDDCPQTTSSLFLSDYLEFVRFSWDLQEYAILGSPNSVSNIRADETTDHRFLKKKSYQDQLQLVLFHPRATHQTYGQVVSPDDDDDNENDDDDNNDGNRAGDYTIRSPFPTVHLLREVDVLAAVQSGYPGLEHLPARNQARMQSQGTAICQERLEACRR